MLMHINKRNLFAQFRNTRECGIQSFDYFCTRLSSTNTTNKPKDFNLSKVLIFNKITRYEYEKNRFGQLDENRLKEEVSRTGSNFDRLISHHDKHYKSLETIVQAFKDHKIDTKVRQRHTYSPQDIEWADAIFTAGGDGTFLLAAAKVMDCKKPVIGINTDSMNSEGYLLLPAYYSNNFSKTLDKILRSEFKWLCRSRIRVYIEGSEINKKPIDFHDQTLKNYELRSIEHINEERDLRNLNDSCVNDNLKTEFLVPVRSLNEVFIGESLSAKVSYYQMSVDDGPFFKQKSSGIIVCTGTGSTSWCYNINKMSEQSMKEIVNIINKKMKNENLIPKDDRFVSEIVHEFNNSLVFAPDALEMSYTIRDPIINRIFTNETNRGSARKLKIMSRCFDACLVIDGSVSYQFNAGTSAVLAIYPEDCLRTIEMVD